MDRQEVHERRACNLCRTRKVRCDRATPSCLSCRSHNRQCVYSREAAKPRPSTAAIQALRTEKNKLEQILIRIKRADTQHREALLGEITLLNGSLKLSGAQSSNLLNSQLDSSSDTAQNYDTSTPTSRYGEADDHYDDLSSPDETLDMSSYACAGEQGPPSFFGPTSALYNSSETSRSPSNQPPQSVRNQLIANSFIQRQKEYELQSRGDFDGLPAETALHLLNLHWNRQHHNFHLTYRPAFTRDLMHRGPYYSRFLLNAIFASGSKFSDRIELRDDPCLPQTAGNRFLRRCQELILVDSLLERSSIPTVVGLLHLGSSYIARGETSKSWIYTGLAIRMAFDLGLHLDIQSPDISPEDVEIRRRAFWAAFITDKLQCLYLGRPVAIHLRDSHVSTEFLDTTEELEPWIPYADPQRISVPQQTTAIPTFSISAFQQFCLLSKLMSAIINRFYFIGAKKSDPYSSLRKLDHALSSWYENLPDCLVFQPWSSDPTVSSKRVTTNIMGLHCAYHSLVILLHRPFVSDGNLRCKSPPANSWKSCSTSAANITGIVDKWRDMYALCEAPYLLGYSAYVACTIHVRDAALNPRGRSYIMLMSTLNMLNEMSSINPGLIRSEKLIRDLMHVNGISAESAQPPDVPADAPFDIDIDALIRMFPDPYSDQLIDSQMQTLHDGYGTFPDMATTSFLGDSHN